MKPWVSAIVPAFNEAPRIGAVLSVLTTTPMLDEIIVVDDGSTDGTADVARRERVYVKRSAVREGKGGALRKGVAAAKGSVLFFCDSDISGLTPQIVNEILEPVLRGSVEMCIGARASKVRHLGFGLTYSPLIDGQRALTREVWNRVPERFKSGYKIETALNFFAKTCSHNVYDITQSTKEQKIGCIYGARDRYRMYWDIVLAKFLIAKDYISSEEFRFTSNPR